MGALHKEVASDVQLTPVSDSNRGKKLAEKIIKAHLGRNVEAKEIIAMKKYTPLEWVDEAVINDKKNPVIRAKARHLYWACFRGHIPLIKYILDNDKISPFARVLNKRSPMMASLLGKHCPMKPGNSQTADEKLFSATVNNRAQVEICSREYEYEADKEMLEDQMLKTDFFGNNAMHLAFRSKKPKTIDLIIRAGFGDIDHRNILGQTPKEASHNGVLMKETKELLA